MLEAAAMIFAGYMGYADWPWWWATILGAVAGVWNACNRFFLGPWRARIHAAHGAMRGVLSLLFVCVWTGSIAAALFTGIYFAVQWIVS